MLLLNNRAGDSEARPIYTYSLVKFMVPSRDAPTNIPVACIDRGNRLDLDSQQHLRQVLSQFVIQKDRYTQLMSIVTSDRVYLVMVVQTDRHWVAQLHPASDPATYSLIQWPPGFPSMEPLALPRSPRVNQYCTDGAYLGVPPGLEIHMLQLRVESREGLRLCTSPSCRVPHIGQFGRSDIIIVGQERRRGLLLDHFIEVDLSTASLFRSSHVPLMRVPTSVVFRVLIFQPGFFIADSNLTPALQQAAFYTALDENPYTVYPAAIYVPTRHSRYQHVVVVLDAEPINLATATRASLRDALYGACTSAGLRAEIDSRCTNCEDSLRNDPLMVIVEGLRLMEVFYPYMMDHLPFPCAPFSVPREPRKDALRI